MTKLHLACTVPTLTFLTALLCAGLAQNTSAIAQSVAPSIAQPTPSPNANTPGRQLVFGGGSSSFSSGILPPAGHSRIGNYFDRQHQYGIALGPTPDVSDDGSPPTDQYWLEFGGTAENHHRLNAQIGLGYSPTPDLGIAVGSYFDVNAATNTGYGNYQPGGYAQPRLRQRPSLTESGSFLNDAGLAASLSYMPFADIWIGLHGSVSRNLSTTPTDDGTLDGIDAMLGLTATYKVEF